MNRKIKILICSLLILLIGITFSQDSVSNFPVLNGPYFGQKPPGLTPEMFAPGIISTDLHEVSSGFNLDSTFFVFQRIEDKKVITYEMERKNEQWTKPKVVPFAHMMRNGDFVFASDGKTLYFQSNTPIDGLESEGIISNIWITKKTETTWTEPKHLGFSINTKWLDSFASATTEGTLYFFSQNPVESYLIFCSTKPEGYGSDDFYISFRNKDLSWSKPVNMGEEINSESSENRPYVTPDGKYFFFTSTKRGNRDIYWVDAGIIETYRIRKNQDF